MRLDRQMTGKTGRILGDWVFWAVVGGMALAVAANLLAAVFQKRDPVAPVAAPDVQVYRAQLAEVERDVVAGRLAATDADRLRIEISRRILDADRQSDAAEVSPSDGRYSLVVISGIVVAAILGSVALYARMGAPGYADLPIAARMEASTIYRATRPKQAVAEAAATLPDAITPDAEFAALLVKLRQTVADRPTDQQGLALLARNEAALGNLAAARDAQAALILAKGDAATAGDHATLAELMIGLTGGYVSPEAEAELIKALELDPENGMALYYSGLMFAQGDRADLAFRVWQDLLETSAADAPWVGPIRDSIEDMAALAGVTYTLPAPSQPSAAQMDAAAAMTPEDRRAMIETMVSGLSDRLAKEGGPAADWARLITSLGVLGDLPRARNIYAEAQTVFAGRATDLEELRLAAVAAGIAE